MIPKERKENGFKDDKMVFAGDFFIYRCMPFLGFQALPNPPINLPPAGELVPLLQL